MSSVVVFGECSMIKDQDTALKLLKRFASKYYPNKQMIDEEIHKSFKGVAMYEINIKHLSGKKIQEK